MGPKKCPSRQLLYIYIYIYVYVYIYMYIYIYIFFGKETVNLREINRAKKLRFG